MKERPIIMGAESVSAILLGNKTQTRRVIKPQPIIEWDCCDEGEWETVTWKDFEGSLEDLKYELPLLCPYGKVGDRLWVREGFMVEEGESMPSGLPIDPSVHYKSLGDFGEEWTSPIFMPKKLSRIMLEITDVRVERVQDISEQDAATEGWGATQFPITGLWVTGRQRYERAWNLLNAKRAHSWESNPWVWVIEFEVVE